MRKSRITVALAALALAAAARAFVPAAFAAGQDQGWKGIAERLGKNAAKPSKTEPAAKPPTEKKKEADPVEMAPLAKGAPMLVPGPAVRPLLELLAPFARSVLFAGPKYADDPTVLRVVFEGFDGEFLAMEMAWNQAAAEVRPAGPTAESLGRDRAAVDALLRAYTEALR